MEKMKSWLYVRGIKNSEFSREICVSAPTFHNIMNGRNLPSLPVAVAIQRKTGGAVKCEDWIDEGNR